MSLSEIVVDRMANIFFSYREFVLSLGSNNELTVMQLSIISSFNIVFLSLVYNREKKQTGHTNYKISWTVAMKEFFIAAALLFECAIAMNLFLLLF